MASSETSSNRIVLMENRFIFEYFFAEGVGCEVGVWQGNFSKQLYEALHPKKLYLVDPWIMRPDYVNREYSLNRITQYELDSHYLKVLEAFREKQEVVIIRDLFQNCRNRIPNEELDWIYLDGDQSENEIYEDLLLSLQKIKRGGHIAGKGFSRIDPNTNTKSNKNAMERLLETHSSQVKLLTIHNDHFVFKKL